MSHACHACHASPRPTCATCPTTHVSHACCDVGHGVGHLATTCPTPRASCRHLTVDRRPLADSPACCIGLCTISMKAIAARQPAVAGLFTSRQVGGDSAFAGARWRPHGGSRSPAGCRRHALGAGAGIVGFSVAGYARRRRRRRRRDGVLAARECVGVDGSHAVGRERAGQRGRRPGRGTKLVAGSGQVLA